VVELKDLIAVPNIAERLKMPPKTDKKLGPHKEAWCDFHQAFGHPICNCLVLGNQLDDEVEGGRLNTPHEDEVAGLEREGDNHQVGPARG